MGQVPKNQKFLIIGSGRLSKHLTTYFNLLSLSNENWSRQESLELLKQKLDRCNYIILAISDSAIVPFYDSIWGAKSASLSNHNQGSNLKIFVHMSGRVHDPRIASAHPLMAFSETYLDFETYKRIHFVLCGTQGLDQVLPGLPNSFSLINAEQKSLYHSLCVFSGNFSILLWQAAWSKMKNLGIPFSGFESFLTQNLNNFAHNPNTSLTGPLVRKDLETLLSNHQALPENMADLYLNFVKLYSPELFSEIQNQSKRIGPQL